MSKFKDALVTTALEQELSTPEGIKRERERLLAEKGALVFELELLTIDHLSLPSSIDEDAWNNRIDEVNKEIARVDRKLSLLGSNNE